LTPLAVAGEVERDLLRLAELLGGSVHNLVAAGERDSVYERHISECIAVAGHLELRRDERWLDLGTGGGLPGLVLARLFPDAHWSVVDATAKKVAAVRQFADELGLRNVTAVAGRAEELARDASHRSTYAGVVSRAVAPLPALMELARGFLRPGGQLVAVKGPRWREEFRAAERVLDLLGYTRESVVPVESAVRETWLVTMRARGAPPEGIPRNVGIPQRRPIGRPQK
jgi:16S rRNA (guanine527-N7)-methyltransferase